MKMYQNTIESKENYENQCKYIKIQQKSKKINEHVIKYNRNQRKL